MKEKGTADSMTLELALTPEQCETIVNVLKEAIDRAAELFQKVVEAVKIAASVVGKKLAKLLEAELYYANENPRWWHLYKHAKKARTRKKYRRRLMQQLVEKWTAAERMKKEATT